MTKTRNNKSKSKSKSNMKAKTRTNKKTKVKSTVHDDKYIHEHGTDISKLNCSPNASENEFTCYTNNSLQKMKNIWNMRHPDNKITTNDTKEIWNEFRKKLNTTCHRESCWLRHKFMEGHLDKELLNYTFAPSAPRQWKDKPNEWLSSQDIELVMKQYEHAYKCFEFLGPSPIDFNKHKLYGECVWEELCKFNLHDNIKRNKTKIGIIFNTHPHQMPGEHWISMFVNTKRKYICFFDSNGNKPPKEVNELIEKIKSQGRKLNIQFTTYINDIEHQRTNSECGMYCLYFIIESLKDSKTPCDFLKKRIPDKNVFELRKKYFNVE